MNDSLKLLAESVRHLQAFCSSTECVYWCSTEMKQVMRTLPIVLSRTET